ncbi:Cytochrome P450 [Apiospora hydei]|uniref:Cytochrome P450 n=1 Tax=Apiospora hydei TaxID=1337664 RepID=A0ABR1UVM4_9PEZI
MFTRAGSLVAPCAVLAGGLLLFCFYYLYIRHLFSPFRRLPSPTQGPLLLRLLYEPRLPEIEHWIDTIPNDGLIRYHGLFNRERIFIASPGAAKEFLTTSAYKFIKPQLQYTLANLIAGRGLLILEGEEHKQVRKTLNPAFSPANLREWFPAQWQTAIDALSIVPRYTDVDVDYAPEDGPQTPFSGVTSIQVPIAAASIDMVGHFGYGVDFHTIDTMSTSKFGSAAKHSADKKRRFARAFIHMFKTTRHGQLSLEAASIMGPAITLRLPLRAVKTIKGIMGLFYDTIRDIVEDYERAAAQDEKPAKTQGRTDVLSLAVRSGALSHPDLVEEGVHMTSAGTETLIGTTTWAMHLLSRHPEVQARLREEIRANIPSPYDKAATQAVSQSDLRQLPYLNAVMNEILRFHSVNGLLWRQCTEPAVLAGVPIPKGTTVTFSPWALNRDPRHWGADARVFDPARWVAHPSTGGADHAYSFATFGGGPRRCIGEGYARDQLLCVLAAYVGRYELTPLDPLSGTDDGTEIGSNFALTLFKVYEGGSCMSKRYPGGS